MSSVTSCAAWSPDVWPKPMPATSNGRAAPTSMHWPPGLERCLPFVSMFYTQPSTYVWHDQEGNPHDITQAEGGEQGDPLMPALFSLGQKAALQAVQQQLQPGEALYAFLDDVYTIVSPARVRPVFDLLSHHLFHSAHIQLNTGKTRVWNAAGLRPPNLEGLGDNVWVGNQNLPTTEQGLMVLGTPLGTPQYQQHPSTTNCPTASQPWATCRPHGSCYYSVPAPAAITNFACPRNNNQFCRTRCRRGHMLHPALRHSPIASNSPCNSTPSTSTGRPRPHLGSRDS